MQLHCAWCHCSHLCCHPWWVFLVLKPESSLCLFMLEVRLPFICLQPEIPIKLRSAMDSPHPRYHKNRESCTDLLHQHIAFTYFLLSSQVYYYYYPTSAKDMKEFLPNFRPWQDSDQERATRLTPTRALLIFCDPTIVKDPKRTPATASLFDLQGLQKNFLSNHSL